MVMIICSININNFLIDNWSKLIMFYFSSKNNIFYEMEGVIFFSLFSNTHYWCDWLP